MGAKLAFPDQDVACVTGDGSIQMMLQELATMKQYHTPVKIVNLNNGYLGMVRQWQEFFYQKRYSMTYLEASAGFRHAGRGLRPRRQAHREAGRCRRGAARGVCHEGSHGIPRLSLPIRGENVFPMIPSGGGQNEMLLAERDEMVSTHDEGHGAAVNNNNRHLISILMENEAGASVAGRQSVFGARLQHREPDRRAHRRPNVCRG
jgi:acetolactate synthase-1/2/3 large subunit